MNVTRSLIADRLSLLSAAVFARLSDQPFAISSLQAPPPKPAPTSPIIVKVITPPHDPTGISDVIIGAIGLTGFIVLLAIVLGLIMAGIMFWMRSRNPLSH